MTIASIVATGDYSQTNNCGSSMAAGGSCTITVTFSPTAAGSRPGAITITDNNNAVNGSTQSVTLTGTGAVSTGTAVPSSLNFGNQFLGALSAAQAVTITNTGTLPITFYNFSASGDFAIAGGGTTCSTASPLGVSTSCTVAVTFMPSGTGPRKSSLVIADNGSGYAHAIILTGAGTSVGLSPSSLIFTDQTVATLSAPQQITLTNYGNGPINIWQTAILGVAASDFLQVSNCGSTLAATASCTISVTFTPGVAGPRSAALVVSNDGGGGLQSAALTGNGVAPALPATSLVAQATTSNVGATSAASITNASPTSTATSAANGSQAAIASIGVSAARLSFDKLEIGKSSSPQTVTLTNTGASALTLRKVELIGAGHNDFDLTNQCKESLEAGQSCTLQITFTPRAPGTRGATLSIEDEALSVRHQLSLVGTGLKSKTKFRDSSFRLF
jgi:hypothetical protein